MAADTQTEAYIQDHARVGVYQVILKRRDVRGQFKPDPIPDKVLSRILLAAHYAPSVGFMQPWNFIIVKDSEIKQRVHKAFKTANAEAANMFEGEKRERYQSLKLEGILEAPINICITCDRNRTGPVVVGRTHIKAMDLYSCVCAVQNLWLAARAEGLGVGWVSIFNQAALRECLHIPRNIIPIAYLCVGYVTYFHEKPELQTIRWLPRLQLDELIYFDQWGQSTGTPLSPLLQDIRRDQASIEQEGFIKSLSE